jgi:hypothetical protein
LKESLGYEVSTFLRTPHEVSAVAKYKAFKVKGEALNIAFVIGFGQVVETEECIHECDCIRHTLEKYQSSLQVQEVNI